MLLDPNITKSFPKFLELSISKYMAAKRKLER